MTLIGSPIAPEGDTSAVRHEKPGQQIKRRRHNGFVPQRRLADRRDGDRPRDGAVDPGRIRSADERDKLSAGQRIRAAIGRGRRHGGAAGKPGGDEDGRQRSW
jgi:hypothetical protein